MRTYKRKPGNRSYALYPAGNRSYALYPAEAMQNALLDISTNRISIFKASKLYGIPNGTLYSKSKLRHMKNIGGQTRLRPHTEEKILQIISILTDWNLLLD